MRRRKKVDRDISNKVFKPNKGPRPNHTTNPYPSPILMGHYYNLNPSEAQTQLARFQSDCASKKPDAWKNKDPSARHAPLPSRLDRHRVEASPEFHHPRPRTQRHQRATHETSSSFPRFPHRSNRELIRQIIPRTTSNQEPTHTLKTSPGPEPIQLDEAKQKPATQDCESLHPPETRPTTVDLKEHPPLGDKTRGDEAVRASPSRKTINKTKDKELHRAIPERRPRLYSKAEPPLRN
ncbi:hypothetical protein YC2023_001907 [Brassica napus]